MDGRIEGGRWQAPFSQKHCHIGPSSKGSLSQDVGLGNERVQLMISLVTDAPPHIDVVLSPVLAGIVGTWGSGAKPAMCSSCLVQLPALRTCRRHPASLGPSSWLVISARWHGVTCMSAPHVRSRVMLGVGLPPARSAARRCAGAGRGSRRWEPWGRCSTWPRWGPSKGPA